MSLCSWAACYTRGNFSCFAWKCGMDRSVRPVNQERTPSTVSSEAKADGAQESAANETNRVFFFASSVSPAMVMAPAGGEGGDTGEMAAYHNGGDQRRGGDAGGTGQTRDDGNEGGTHHAQCAGEEAHGTGDEADDEFGGQGAEVVAQPGGEVVNGTGRSGPLPPACRCRRPE